MKRQILYGFMRHSEESQLLLCSEVVPNYSLHAPLLPLKPIADDVNALHAQWQVAIAAAANKDRSKIEVKNGFRTDTMDMLYRLGMETELLADGNRGILLMSSFPLRADPQPVNNMPAPVIQRIMKLANAGCVKVTWTPVRGTIAYAFESSVDNQVVWQNGDYCQGVKKKVSGFTPGVWTWFRVKAIGATTSSDWSTPMGCMMS